LALISLLDLILLWLTEIYQNKNHCLETEFLARVFFGRVFKTLDDFLKYPSASWSLNLSLYSTFVFSLKESIFTINI